jgi:hypothetical protein
VASGGVFVTFLVAVIGERDPFGLGLLRLGFGSPTSMASSAFAVQ